MARLASPKAFSYSPCFLYADARCACSMDRSVCWTSVIAWLKNAMAFGYKCCAASLFPSSKVVCTASKGRAWHTKPSLSDPTGYWYKGILFIGCNCVALHKYSIVRTFELTEFFPIWSLLHRSHACSDAQSRCCHCFTVAIPLCFSFSFSIFFRWSGGPWYKQSINPKTLLIPLLSLFTKRRVAL